jgi:hypothetical protein
MNGDGAGRERGGPTQGGNLTLLRQLEQAREQRGSPSLWDAVAARLDAEDRQRDAVAPMLRLLDKIHERVDDETWRLILDFEWHSSREIVTGVEVGLELGYANGRAAALVEARHAPGHAAKVLQGRLADLLGDTEAEPSDVLLALVATLQAAVMTTRGGGPAMDASPGRPRSASSGT